MLTLVVLISGCRREISPGDRVVIRALPETTIRSALAAFVSVGDSSGVDPVISHMVRDIFGRDLNVTVDRVGPCKELERYYNQANEMVLINPELNPVEREQAILRTVRIPGSDPQRCFSYHVIYRIPISPPLTWADQTYNQLDMRFVFIYPLDKLETE